MPSPYVGRPESEWLSITERLVAAHPLTPKLVHDASLSAWNTVWQTRVGAGKTSVALEDLSVPATIIGYFFEVLLARELEIRSVGQWRGSRSKHEKDLVYEPDPLLSVEVKTSGQQGYRIYGNRSYGQRSENDAFVKKEKSGYYVTVNFVGKVLTLLRFGWIDADDWKSQAAPTGQMAGLSDAVYASKLIPIAGAYRANAPVELLKGVGAASVKELHKLGITTIADLLTRNTELTRRLARIVAKNQAFLDDCRSSSK